MTTQEQIDSQIPATSMPDNFPGAIVGARFEVDTIKQTGLPNVNLWLSINDEDSGETVEKMYSVGGPDQWEVIDGGQGIRPLRSQKRINISSKAGKLQMRILEEIAKKQGSGDIKEGAKFLAQRGGSIFRSNNWTGLSFDNWLQEKLVYERLEVETSILLPRGFRGIVDVAQASDDTIPAGVMAAIKKIVNTDAGQPPHVVIGHCFADTMIRECGPAVFAITQGTLLEDIRTGKV